jgi:hypothetical protein
MVNPLFVTSTGGCNDYSAAKGMKAGVEKSRQRSMRFLRYTTPSSSFRSK